MSAREVQVRLEVKGSPSTSGTAKVVTLTVGERAKSALKLWGTAVLIALPCVAIPLMHFILPPAIFITGTVLAILRFKQGEVLADLTAPCPTCGAVGKLQTNGAVRDGRPLHCDGCGFTIALRLPESAAGAAAPVQPQA